jgi:hypothetical protein
MNLRERAKQLKTDIPALFLALKSPETPIIAKILAGITILYALSPIDFIKKSFKNAKRKPGTFGRTGNRKNGTMPYLYFSSGCFFYG